MLFVDNSYLVLYWYKKIPSANSLSRYAKKTLIPFSLIGKP
jgi:hypothetical protein